MGKGECGVRDADDENLDPGMSVGEEDAVLEQPRSLQFQRTFDDLQQVLQIPLQIPLGMGKLLSQANMTDELPQISEGEESRLSSESRKESQHLLGNRNQASISLLSNRFSFNGVVGLANAAFSEARSWMQDFRRPGGSDEVGNEAPMPATLHSASPIQTRATTCSASAAGVTEHDIMGAMMKRDTACGPTIPAPIFRFAGPFINSLASSMNDSEENSPAMRWHKLRVELAEQNVVQHFETLETGKRLGRISPTIDQPVLVPTQTIDDGLRGDQATSQNAVQELVAKTSARGRDKMEMNGIQQ